MPFTWNTLDEKGELKEVELCQDGLNILITDENKVQYINAVVEFICYGSIKNKIDALTEGFFSVIDRNLISIFNVDELDFILSGQVEIDLNDWRKNTIYKGHYNDNHKVSLI